MKKSAIKSVVSSLLAAISGRDTREIEKDVPMETEMDSDTAQKNDQFLADFRTDRFASGGLALTGPVQYHQMYATAGTAIRVDNMDSAVTPWTPPEPVATKVAKVAVRPKDVLAELGRTPTHWSLEGLDTKIEMLEAKRALITQRYAAQDVEGLLQCLRNRKKYDQRAKDGFTHREFFGRFDATDHAKVQALCTKHGLVLKDADLFIPEMPDEATRAMKAVTDHCMELCGKKPHLYVIANEDQFRDVTAKRDPIVLAQSPFGFYYYILGAWDAEMLYLPEL